MGAYIATSSVTHALFLAATHYSANHVTTTSQSTCMSSRHVTPTPLCAPGEMYQLMCRGNG